MISSPSDEKLICGIKLSTVVPASISGEDKIQSLTNMDLAVKLHHITTVHFFDGEAVQGLDIQHLKEPMFRWLQLYYPICGRIRRDDDRPFIKCNDSGVRIVEAHCTITLEEWLAAGHQHRLLLYYQPIFAQELGFTPLVFLQLTKFKCGGLCVGMRWAHILGDAFSASECINMWAKIMANLSPPPPISLNPPTFTNTSPSSTTSGGRCLKLLDHPLGDNWLTPNNSKMQMHSFHVTEHHLSHLLSGENSSKKTKNQVCPFEVISAIVWKSLAKTKGATDSYKIVTVCKTGSLDLTRIETELPSNTHQVVGTVEAQTLSMVRDADPLDLAKMIHEHFVDETSLIHERMVEDDCILYGSNLTFVDLGDVNLSGLKIKGRLPVFADVNISGVGDEGAIIVVPYVGQSNGGRTVNVSLPEDQLQNLKNELRLQWGIF